IPDCPDPIAPSDFLAFLVGAAVIADADLVDPPAAGKRDLGAELNFTTKVVAGQTKPAHDVSREHLVAALDVRQRLVVEKIENQGTEAIGQIMVVIERAMRPAIEA